MTLITEAYRDQNRQLHADVAEYGASAWGKTLSVREIIEDNGYTTLLDYGCGKGTLAETLRSMHIEGYDTPLEIREYDPAVPGKDAAPEPAQFVVCTDVLEHIEPECLDAVLADLFRLTEREMFFAVCLRPADKCLPDGRNAHLIVESADWWRAQLSRHFALFDTDDTGKWLYGRARPLRPLGEIRHKCAVGSDERQTQVKANIARIGARLTIPYLARMPAHDRKAVLVCYGPSLQDTWATAAIEQAEGADLFTVSAAHKFMIERGVIPKVQIDCDPREHKARQIGEPHPDVEYWLASCIHPTYLDMLEGHTVKLWHAYNGLPSLEVLQWEPGQRMIVGGGSVGLRALSVLYYMGYRRIAIHGLDSSNRDSQQHAGTHLGKRKQDLDVWVAGRKFSTSPALILYARYFLKQKEAMAGCEIEMHGDGMLQHMCKVPTAAAAA